MMRLWAVVALVALALGGVFGLSLAGRPDDRYVVLVTLLVVPTVTSLLAAAKVDTLRHEMRNGTGDVIADKVTERLTNGAPNGPQDIPGQAGPGWRS